MQTVTAACNAMATRFEMVLHGDNMVALRAAADQAFHEIERLHAQLSLYLPSSEISFINARASTTPVRVEPRLFALLQLAERLHQETGGVFDITIGPLIRCWGFMGGKGLLPTPERLAEARDQVGMRHVILDEKHRTIRFARGGMMIDLGSIGKGYALDCAMETLVEAGVKNALVHGGTSTICAIGAPRENESWKIAVETPLTAEAAEDPGSWAEDAKRSMKRPPLAVVTLHNESLSVSAVHGKAFQAEGKTYGHLIDPRTGSPAQGALLAAAVSPSATETDALSTALLLGGIAGLEDFGALRPTMRTLVAEADSTCPEGVRVASRGITPLV